MPDFLKPAWSFMQKIGRFLKDTWASVYAYGLYVISWFAPKPDGFEEVLNRIRANDPQLTHLNLSNKGLTYWNIIELCYVLASNSTLTALNVSSNQIGGAGAQALAANTTLTALSVSNNHQIGDTGAQALAANSTLTALDVSWNHIGGAGAQALAANTTLTALDVRGNNIGNATLLLLKNAIIRNKQLMIDAKKAIMGLHVFASIANGTQATKRLPDDIAWTIGSFLTTDARCLDDIKRRAAVRRSRHMLFQPAGAVDSTIEPIQPAPTNV
jgi:hypothetical protein